MNNHLILKFISEKQYATDFLNGNLYMNSLYYFWNEYPLLVAKQKKEKYITEHPEVNSDEIVIPIEYKLSPGQADLFEGTIGFSRSEIIKGDFGKYMLTDEILRSTGFQYCNTLSFYRLDYSYEPPFFNYDVPNLSEFGDYVVIIRDKGELQRRIGIASERENIDYLCGDIHYKALRCKGRETDLSDKPHLVMKADTLVDLNDYALTSKRDCFFKMDKYAWQKEWRVAIYRGVKDTGAYRLKIGDIRDIAECVSSKELVETLDKLLASDQIRPGGDGYYGNISRKEMKEKYYQLGDNKAELFFFLG